MAKKETTLTYQLGYGGVDPPYPEKGSLKVEHKTFGTYACWRLVSFIDDKGHFEVLAAGTEKWLMDAALDAAEIVEMCKGRK